jgi:uncharacterized membrane protein YebE (DUF533 family)
MDTNRLLQQFLGTGQNNEQPGQASQNGLFGGSVGKAAVAGGVLGLLLGNKKTRKMAGGMMGYGGAAAAGALAYKAYQNWQQGKQVASAPIATPADIAQTDPRFLPPPAGTQAGQSFSLTLINTMIAAAKADGHIDAKEQTAIFEQVEKMDLDTESKAFVFDALRKPVDINAIAVGVQGIEQASEVYLFARMAIDIDHPAERVFLQVLAQRLQLPAELVAHLDHQIVDA